MNLLPFTQNRRVMPVTKVKAQALAEFITEYPKTHHGRMPTYQVMAEHMRASKSQIAGWLTLLEEISFIEFERISPRKTVFHIKSE